MKTLDLTSKGTYEEFTRMAYLIHHLKNCHIEDYEYFKKELNVARSNVICKIIELYGRGITSKAITDIMKNIHASIWNTWGDFLIGYHMWAIMTHKININ